MAEKPGRARPSRGAFDRWSQGSGNARGRLLRGLVVPESHVGFRFAPDAKVFAIGTGFARRIEAALLDTGVRVTSAGRKTDIMEVRSNLRLGILNQHNPVSIHQELEWAAGRSFPEEALLPLGDEWIDPFLGEQAPLAPLPAVRTRRAKLKDYFAKTFTADLVLVTLGFTETWFCRKTKLALNGPPSTRAFLADRDRFAMRRLGHEEMVAALKAIRETIKKQNPKANIVLMVSPVPLKRTFTGEDVIVANMVGKSALHSAAMTVAWAFKDVDYFPAYESVMCSDPARTWQPDRRTVQPGMVGLITDHFVRRYGLMISEHSKTAGTA